MEDDAETEKALKNMCVEGEFTWSLGLPWNSSAKKKMNIWIKYGKIFFTDEKWAVGYGCTVLLFANLEFLKRRNLKR